MARPQKYTVDYFSHDANASAGKTLTILFNNFGHEGISAWWQLLEVVSLTNNHVISLRNPEDLEYLAAKLHFKPERLKEILNKLAGLEAIDKGLFDSGIIWCQNFVNRLEPVYNSRKQEIPLKPIVSLPINPVSLPSNAVDLPDNTHTILKRVILKKESNTKESVREKYTATSVKETFYSFKNEGYEDIKDFDNQYKKFCEYWFEGTKTLKTPKLACHNWLDKAREYQERNGGGNGRNEISGRSPQAIPGNKPAGAFAGLTED